MNKDKVFTILRKILDKSGMNDIVSVSENVNELADIMIYSRDDIEYLATIGRPLFPIAEIQNILYMYGDDKFYNFAGTYLQLVFELNHNNRFVLEFGENGICDAMYSDGEWAKDDADIEHKLQHYNNRILKERNILELICSNDGIIEGEHIESESELNGYKPEIDEVKKAVYSYINSGDYSDDILLELAYSALTMYVYNDIDIYGIKDLIKLVLNNGDINFLDYIRKYASNPSDYQDNGYYLGLATTALRLMREVSDL